MNTKNALWASWWKVNNVFMINHHISVIWTFSICIHKVHVETIPFCTSKLSNHEILNKKIPSNFRSAPLRNTSQGTHKNFASFKWNLKSRTTCYRHTEKTKYAPKYKVNHVLGALRLKISHEIDAQVRWLNFFVLNFTKPYDILQNISRYLYW